MKYLFLFIFILFSTIVRADIEIAKDQCKDLGFKPGTEKYADCVMKLLPKAISKVDKNVKKVEEDNSNSLKFDEATYVGEVKKGKAHGIGVITFSDGSKYEGKVSKNRPHGKGKYTDSKGNVFEGKFRRNKFIDKINKNTRKIFNLNVKEGVSYNFEIRGTGKSNTRWFEAEEISLGVYELTIKGKREMDRANESGGGDGGGGGGGCG